VWVDWRNTVQNIENQRQNIVYWESGEDHESRLGLEDIIDQNTIPNIRHGGRSWIVLQKHRVEIWIFESDLVDYSLWVEVVVEKDYRWRDSVLQTVCGVGWVDQIEVLDQLH